MAAEAMRAIAVLGVALAFSAAGVLLLSRLASHLGLVDHPGGRKEHGRSVPLVGGLAIFTAFGLTTGVTGILDQASWLLFALSLVIAIGLWDDAVEIGPRAKLAIEIVASGVMIWGAGVELHSVGDLLGWRPIGLWILAVPMTVFSIVGVVNAVNMMDGLDGLGGSISFVAFAWYAAMARLCGLDAQFDTAVILCSAIAGFLIFNLRLPWQPHARVFLGDAGSLMIGFALGWLAIDVTQGAGRMVPPIAALWVVLVPLADCVSLMARRIAAGRSPFVADRHHIHHYLLARGLTPNQVVGSLTAISAACGAVGFAGWQLGVPEAALFWPFFFGFFAYHLWIQRAWNALEAGSPALPMALDEDEARALG